MDPRINRENVVQILFETFNVPAEYISNQAVTSLIASEMDSGVAVCLGNKNSSVVPVISKRHLSFATKNFELAGQAISDFISRVITERGFKTSQGRIDELKHEFSCVSLDLEKEMKSFSQIEKKFEDGVVILVGEERYQAPEILFDPSIIGYEQPGIHKLVFDSVMSCEESIQSELFSKIVLQGGTSLIPGIAERLQIELEALVPKETKVVVSSPLNRKESAWIGASILSSSPGFEDILVSTDEYNEHGPIVSRLM